MRIFIIGFMGSGKTTYGKQLASLLAYNFIDTDKEVEKISGQNISHIFSQFGENYFRKTETDILEKILKKDNVVVATGGGTPIFNNNINKMNKVGVTLFLKMEHNTLFERLLLEKDNRPLIKGKNSEELKNFIINENKKRLVFYRQAKYIVNPEFYKPEFFSLFLNKLKH